MILKIKRYLFAHIECCEVSIEGSYINMKLRIGNRESVTGNSFLVPYLSKCIGYFKTVKSEPGNREPETSSSFWNIILMFQKCKPGKGTSSRFLIYYNLVKTSFYFFFLFHQHVRH